LPRRRRRSCDWRKEDRKRERKMIKAKSIAEQNWRKLLKSRKQSRKSFKKQNHYKEIIEMERQSLQKLLKFKLIWDILKVSSQDSRLRIKKKGEERTEQQILDGTQFRS